MSRLSVAVALAAPWLAMPAYATAEENARITGTAAGPGCELIAVGVTRQNLRYPLLGASGWSRGVPTVTKNVAELWLLDTRTNTLRLATSIPSPKRWTDATRYAIVPRVLTDQRVVYTLHGCPVENPNCTESSAYAYTAGTKPKALAAPPPLTAEDSAMYRACTTSLTYTADNTPQVSIGPTGGPWRPVLEFKAYRLAPARTP